MSPWKARLNTIVNDNTTKEGRFFDHIIEALIFISLVAYAFSTEPDLSKQTYKILDWIEIVSVSVFTVEYVIRVFVAKNPWKYIFSFYGVIDLIAILPTFIGSHYNLMALRIFRIFRIFRAFKLIRYNKALGRFRIVWTLIREEVMLFFIVTSIFLFLASAGIYYFENNVQPEKFSSIFSSAWWAVVTLTTVGYGDVYPITVGGKIFTFFILMVGVGIVTIPAGLVASALTKARQMEDDEVENIKKREKLKYQRKQNINPGKNIKEQEE